MDVQRTFSACLTHAWGTLLKQYLIKSERAWSVQWRASNVRQTRWKGIQCACSTRGTYSKRISHTPGTRRASSKFLSMFKIFLIPNAHETRDDFYRHTATRAGHTPNVHNILLTCLRRVSAVCGILQFCNTPSACFTYTLMCDCCLRYDTNQPVQSRLNKK